MSWEAFCTMFWFATGDKVVRESEHPLTAELYAWWFNLEDQHNDAGH